MKQASVSVVQGGGKRRTARMDARRLRGVVEHGVDEPIARQAEDLADEVLEIADDSSRDYKKKIGADGKVTWVVDRAHIARYRLRIKTAKGRSTA